MNYLKILFTFLILIVINSCTNANKSEENLKKLDKIYGYCDNPHRNIPPKQYETCLAKQDAAGPDGEIGEPVSISDIFDKFFGGRVSRIACSILFKFLSKKERLFNSFSSRLAIIKVF